jgi:hypothetical protein
VALTRPQVSCWFSPVFSFSHSPFPKMFWSQMLKTAGRESRNPTLNHYENLALNLSSTCL